MKLWNHYLLLATINESLSNFESKGTLYHIGGPQKIYFLKKILLLIGNWEKIKFWHW